MRKKHDSIKKYEKAWVVSMDMGYGHQRAAYPLRDFAEGGDIICADNYKGMPASDRETWKQQRDFYNKVSRAKKLPIIGDIVFGVFDKFQEIKPFYPKRNLSRPSLQGIGTYAMIKNKKWGKDLIDKLAKKPIPIITTFFVLAYMAEEHGYPGSIYLTVTDADISRAWAPIQPSQSGIRYLAPTNRAYERLQMYGIRKENIHMTGFPLPCENTGSDKLSVLRKDLGRRIIALDPKKQFMSRYSDVLEKNIGKTNLRKRKPDKPLTIMFAVGGAGAQREIGVEIIKSVRQHIQDGLMRVILVAGTHRDVRDYFKESINKLNIDDKTGDCVDILYSSNKDEYFEKFNNALHATDILWTKPSELSFYCALGIPIIMSEPIGSQEKFNRKWLISIGAGIDQEDVRHSNEWIVDWLESGRLAEAAMQGFLEAPKHGTYNIREIVTKQKEKT